MAPATTSTAKKTTPGSVPTGLNATAGDRPPSFASKSHADATASTENDIADADYADWPYGSKFYDFWDAVERCAGNPEDPCADLCIWLKNKLGTNTRHAKNGDQPACVIAKPGIPIVTYGESKHPKLEESLTNHLLPPAEEFENPTEDDIRAWRETLDPSAFVSVEPTDRFFIGRLDGDADENPRFIFYVITVKITQKDGAYKYELSKLNLNKCTLPELANHYFSYALQPGSEAGANLTEAIFQFDGVEEDIKIVVPWVHDDVWKWISEGRDPEKIKESASAKGKAGSKSKAAAAPKSTTSKSTASSSSSSSSAGQDAKKHPPKTSRVEDLVPPPDNDAVDGEEESEKPAAAAAEAKKKVAPSPSPKKTTPKATPKKAAAPKKNKEEKEATVGDDDDADGDDDLFAADDDDDAGDDATAASQSQAAPKDPHAAEKVVLSKTGKRPVDVALDDRRAKAQKISAAASPSLANGKGAKPTAPSAPKAAAPKTPAAKASSKKSPAPSTPKSKAPTASSTQKSRSTPSSHPAPSPPGITAALVERYKRLLDYRARFHAPLANGGIAKINERLTKNGKPAILDYPTALEEGMIGEKDPAIIERLHIPHLQLFAYLPDLEDVMRQRVAWLEESLAQDAAEQPEEENEFDLDIF